MLIKDIMKKNVVAIPAHMTFIDVVHTFLDNNISGAPIIDRNDTIVGMVTEKDLLKAFYPTYHEYCEKPTNFLLNNTFFHGLDDKKKCPITDIMNTQLLLAKPENAIRHIGGKMVATGIHQAPVVEDNKLIGMVTRRDIYRALLNEQFQINVYTNIYVQTPQNHS